MILQRLYQKPREALTAKTVQQLKTEQFDEEQAEHGWEN